MSVKNMKASINGIEQYYCVFLCTEITFARKCIFHGFVFLSLFLLKFMRGLGIITFMPLCKIRLARIVSIRDNRGGEMNVECVLKFCTLYIY